MHSQIVFYPWLDSYHAHSACNYAAVRAGAEGLTVNVRSATLGTAGIPLRWPASYCHDHPDPIQAARRQHQAVCSVRSLLPGGRPRGCGRHHSHSALGPGRIATQGRRGSHACAEAAAVLQQQHRARPRAPGSVQLVGAPGSSGSTPWKGACPGTAASGGAGGEERLRSIVLCAPACTWLPRSTRSSSEPCDTAAPALAAAQAVHAAKEDVEGGGPAARPRDAPVLGAHHLPGARAAACALSQ